MRVGFLFVCSLILTACGGGGDGGGAPQPAFTLNPSTVTATFQAGTSASVSVVATPTTQLSGTIYATILDRNGVLLPSVTFTPVGGQSYSVGLSTSPSLKVGHYTGSFQVNVCYDANCAKAVAGSPVSVPFDFTVTDPGSGGSPSSAPLTLNPATANGSFTAADPFPFSIDVPATVAAGLSTPYVAANDPNGRILTTATLTPSPGSSSAYILTLQADSTLQPGSYSGTFQLNVCADQNCAQPVAGSPITVPYNVQVAQKPANAGITPLTPWSGVGDWETFQRDAGHTGFVPVTLTPEVFAARWLWTPQNNSLSNILDAPKASAVTVAGGQVYFNSGYVTYALKEFDKGTVWHYDFSGVSSYPGSGPSTPAALNPPAASGGKAYVATSGQQGTFMFALNAADGTVVFQTPFYAQWEHYLAPTVDNGVVFEDGGYYGGMFAFDANTGAQTFTAPLQQFDEWTPAVDANYAYAYIGGQTANTPAQLNMIDRHTGTVVASILDSSYRWLGYSMRSAPVLGQAGSVFAVNVGNPQSNALLNFDTNAKTIRWQVAGHYTGNPAYAANVLYAVNSSPLQLEARSESDGTLLWTWAPQLTQETTFVGDVLVTNNVVFVSTNAATYAISLSTHQMLWNILRPGRLALSANGVLYVVLVDTVGNPDGRVLAINVKS